MGLLAACSRTSKAKAGRLSILPFLVGAFWAVAPVLYAQVSPIDRLPAPQVLIPRTNLVPADADYSGVRPQMMGPHVTLRPDNGTSASASSSSQGSPTVTVTTTPPTAPAADGGASPGQATAARGSKSSAPRAQSAQASTVSPETYNAAPSASSAAPAATVPSSTQKPAAMVEEDQVPVPSTFETPSSIGQPLNSRGQVPTMAQQTVPSIGSTTATPGAMRPTLPEITQMQPGFRSTVAPIRAPRPPDDEYYNVKVGSALFRLSASLGQEYNDNINTAKHDRLWDYGITPSANVNIKWPITVSNGIALNTLNFDLGMGYTYYLNHQSSFDIPLSVIPNSSLNFNVLLGDDVTVTLFDNFGYQTDPIQATDLSGIASFEELNNTTGANVTWDLNALVLNFGYGFGEVIHPQTKYSYLDRDTHNFSAAATLALSELTTLGLQTSATRTEFWKNVRADSWSMSVGPFAKQRVSDYISLEASGGLTMFSFDQGAGSTLSSNNNYYLSGLLRHIVNEKLSYEVNLTRDVEVGDSSDLFEQFTASLRPSYQFLANWTCGTDFFYQNGHQVGEGGGETINRYGAGIGFSHQINDHLSGGISYRYILSDSNIATNGYYQNRVFLSLDYGF